MKYQMIIVVEADKTSEAVIKGESIGDVLSIQARPTPQQPGNISSGITVTPATKP